MKQRLLFLMSLFVLMTVGGAAFAAAPAEDEVLSPRQESIVVISAFAAQGDLESLKTALADGLNNGLTVNEEKELLVQLYAYAGFPRSLNGLNTLMTVLEERKAHGITDTMGSDADPVDPNRDRHAIGDANQTKLVGQPVKGKVYEFCPTISDFLKEHLFGDIFERTVLTWNERELATVSMLAGIGNVNAQLASHMNVAMHNGVTGDQLKAMAKLLGQRVGKAAGDNAMTVAKRVLGE